MRPFCIPLALALATSALTLACGGEANVAGPPQVAPPVASAARPAAPPSAPASRLVSPVAERPVPPLVLGSKVARVRGRTEGGLGDPAPAACARKAQGAPAARARAILAACAPGATPTADHTFALTAAGPAARATLKADAGACYRFAAAADAATGGLVLVVLDASGAVALESQSDDGALLGADDGPLCFSAATEARVLVASRTGDGAAALVIARSAP